MQVWLIPIVDERVCVQVKLWNPLRTRAIPEHFCSGDSLWRGDISSVWTFTFTLISDLIRQRNDTIRNRVYTSAKRENRLTEVRMVHGLASCHPILMIVAQQLVQEVQRLGTHELFVFTVNKPLPALPRMSSHKQRNTVHYGPDKRRWNFN